jgi:hypothetical protein
MYYAKYLVGPTLGAARQQMPPRSGRFGAEMDVKDAAKALLADSIHLSANVLAFQQAWNAAGKSPTLSEDGIWGPNTASALANYGQVYQGKQVARQATPVSAQDLANALATIWPVVIGGAAPAGAITVLLAQSAFETGAWKACWNWNLGNVKHTPGDGFDWFVMTASEGEGANQTMVSSAFRAYPSLQAGAKAYLAILRQRFSSAWSYVLDGDTDGFVQALKDQNYFTGNLEQYQAGVTRYWNQFQNILPTVQQLESGAKFGVGSLLALAIGIYAGSKAYEHRAAIGHFVKDKYEILTPGGKKVYSLKVQAPAEPANESESKTEESKA